jgi:hypothetical protein
LWQSPVLKTPLASPCEIISYPFLVILRLLQVYEELQYHGVARAIVPCKSWIRRLFKS